MSERPTAASRAPRRKLMLRLAIAGIVVLVAAGALLARGARGNGGPSGRRAAAPDASVKNEERITVEVLNATDVRGLARRATLLLRDRGFDVVFTGTAPAQLDSTLVLDRSGNAARARQVAEALGGARVESRPDSSRYLDVTVMLGRSWRAPAEPFHP